MYKIVTDLGVGQWDRVQQALEPLLGGSGVENVSKYFAQEVLPGALDQLVPAAIDYADRNRAAIIAKAAPVVERYSDDPMVRRIVRRRLHKYGEQKFYPKYGKYAAPALALGSGLLVGSLGAGYFALARTKEKSVDSALPLVILTWAANLSGIALTATGVGLAAANRVFQHGKDIT